MGVVLGSLVLGWWSTVAVRGRNLSDVGVSVYERSSLALLLGVVLPIAVTSGALWMMGRLRPEPVTLLWTVGLSALALGGVPHAISLLWVFG